MNVMDKRKMLEGVLYNFNLSRDVSEKEMDALIQIRDIMKGAGLILSANEYRQLSIRQTETGKEIGIGLFI